MSEGFEPYHVPQQSRRDKLRVVVVQNQTNHQPSCLVEPSAANLHGCAGLLPLYDPSLLQPDLLACAGGGHNSISLVKEEGGGGANLIGFVGGGGGGGGSSSSSASSYLDPHSAMVINPSPIGDIGGASHPLFLYAATQGMEGTLGSLSQPYNNHNSAGGGEPPLSLAHDSGAGNNGQGLSLSLSSHAGNPGNHQNALPLELNLQRFGSAAVYGGKAAASGGGGYMSSPVPLGPFTGYASILKGSRFLRPAQQLLEELCEAGRAICTEKITADSCSMTEPSMENLSGGCGMSVDDGCGGDGGEFRRKKSRLISMLDEVCRRYKQYCQQMQAVVASFECVAGLSNAAPYANLALKAMSKHFKCLKNAIADQLQFTNKTFSQVSQKRDDASRLGTEERVQYAQRAIQNSGYLEHQPVWRPQRGLPERAVTVLRAWLFEHFLHPYPTDTDKLMLAKQTGLSRSQVSNWFINARVRLWKPMVEEIHMLETQQAQKPSQREDRNVNKSIDQLPLVNSFSCENPSTSAQRLHDALPKRTRSELPIAVPMRNDESLNLYHNISSHPHVAVSESIGGVSSGVSLTLGLHQNNNGIGLSDSFPVNAAQRFGIGLETTNEGYVVGSFEAQDRHFGRDVFGGQLLHDFVG
ncbi:hypothetical protein NL676_003054 [Syzygium grande]|nr:hypothetical protein NL676_003054 [Syzygium grande]